MCIRRSLRVAIVALALVGNAPAYPQATPQQAQPGTVEIDPYVAEAAQRFGIPEQWIYAVMRAESAGRIGAVSSAGAIGLMQLMPATWARQRARLALGADPFDPRDNILAGASYLREMYDRYGASGFLAAYNAGPGRYEEWRDRGRPLPAETRAYVDRISLLLQTASAPTVGASASPTQQVRTSWAQSQLFTGHTNAATDTPIADINDAAAATLLAPSRSLGVLFAPVSGGCQQ